jgi:hypothetical protein
MDPTTAEQARIQRLRRLARRHGLWLRKSRIRTPESMAYGKWYLMEPHRNVLVRECQDLDQVEAFLRSEPTQD